MVERGGEEGWWRKKGRRGAKEVARRVRARRVEARRLVIRREDNFMF